MPRVRTLLLSLALGVASAGIVACGSNGAGLIPATSAAAMLAKLDRVAELAEEGNCETAASVAREVDDQIDALPPDTDERLIVALKDGVNRLIRLTGDPVTCTGEETTETVPTVTQTQTIPPTVTTQTTPDGGGGVGPGGEGGGR